MSRKRAAAGGSVPLFHANTAYKKWVREQIKARKWSLREFAARITRAGQRATDEALSQFLGPLEGDVAPPSNTSLMPAINRVLKIAAPPVCDPASPVAQLRDRLEERWEAMTPSERRALIAMLTDDAAADLTE